MLQTTVGFHGGGGDSRFQDWGWVFSIGKDKPSRPTVNAAQPVISISLGIPSAPNEICGVVQQLFKTKSHYGLTIQLQGTLEVKGSSTTVKCQLVALSSKTEKKYKFPAIGETLAGSDSGRTCVETKSYQKFPFRLKLPENPPLPPSLLLHYVQVQYKLVVKMRLNPQNSSFSSLGSTTLPYNGQLTLNKGVGLKEEQFPLEKRITIGGGGVTSVIQVPKREFLLKEDVPFVIKFLDPEQENAAKLITVSLLKVVTCDLKKEEATEAQVLDCVTFKRFLKRREFERSGKLKWGKGSRCSTYFGNDSLKLKVNYVIEVKITTDPHQNPITERIDIIIGTDSILPVASAPSKGQRSVDNLPLGLEGSPSGPLRSLIGSILSLSVLPPSYSQVPSRAGSIMSLETLPPHYDDLSSSIDQEEEEAQN